MERRAFVREAAEKFGDQCIVVAVDAKKVSQPGEKDRWEIFTHGGRKPTGLDAVEYARSRRPRRRRNPAHLDGSGRHPLRLRHSPHAAPPADAVPVPVIASGGVGTLQHLVDGIREGRATAVLAASIFHFGQYSVSEAKQFMAKAGLPVRLDA